MSKGKVKSHKYPKEVYAIADEENIEVVINITALMEVIPYEELETGVEIAIYKFDQMKKISAKIE